MKMLNYKNNNTPEVVFCAEIVKKYKDFSGTCCSFHLINKLDNFIKKLESLKIYFWLSFLLLKHWKYTLI